MSLNTPVVPQTNIKKVAMLFSGGPAPAANSVICSAAMCFSRAGIEVYGMRYGYTSLADYKDGDVLVEGKDYLKLNYKDLEGCRSEGGIIIGSARVNPGKLMKTPADLTNPETNAPMQRVYKALMSMGIDALISIGGDDTLTTAAKFKLYQDTLPADAKRIKVVHLPKTIDNDYKGIDFTFGYFSAVDLLATQMRNLLADAKATQCYYVAQLMGRAAAWLSYGACIAGEASLVVGLEDIVEEWWMEEDQIDTATGETLKDANGNALKRKVINIQALCERMADTVCARLEEGKTYGTMGVAEGIGEYLPMEELKRCVSEDEYKNLKPDTFGHYPVSQLKFSSRLGRIVADIVNKRVGKKIKFSGLQFGYEVRCHRPTAFDIILGSQLGTGAYRALVEKGIDGVMVSVTGQLELVFPKFEDLIAMEKLRAYQRPIDPNEAFHQLARYMESWK